MPVRIGQRFVLRGSIAQIILSYAVSEPGEWTAISIADDIAGNAFKIIENIRSLKRRGMISAAVVRGPIHPTELGRVVLFNSMGRPPHLPPIAGRSW